MLDIGNPEKNLPEELCYIPNGSRLQLNNQSDRSFKMESFLIAMADLKAGIVALKYNTELYMSIDFKRQYMRIDFDQNPSKWLDVTVNTCDKNLVMTTSNLQFDNDVEAIDDSLCIYTSQHTQVNEIIDIIIEILAQEVAIN